MPVLRIDPYHPDDLPSLVPMWRASFEHGVGITDPHPIEAQMAYFEREVQPHCRVRIARCEGSLVGFLASTSDTIAQLYVRVGQQRRGIGRQLLDLAKGESGGSLQLYTFARNLGACAFYESQGFVVQARGFEPTWQLEDVKYLWTAPPTHTSVTPTRTRP